MSKEPPMDFWSVRKLSEKYNTRSKFWSEFAKRFPRHYAKCLREYWLCELCGHMISKSNRWTMEQCSDSASLCKSRKEFRTKFGAQYEYSRVKGWLNDICGHMGEYQYGFRKSDFIKSCIDNNEGFGTFYLLKCFDDTENFYKIGVTSHNVVHRYSVFNDMPYEYDILIEFEADAEFIWNLESLYKKRTCNYRYRPELWKAKTSTECFKCHGNSKLIKELMGI